MSAGQGVSLYGPWGLSGGGGDVWAFIAAQQISIEALLAGAQVQADIDDPVSSVTYNADGSVATDTVSGILTTYAYNPDGSVATTTRLGVTRTYAYNPDGSLQGVS